MTDLSHLANMAEIFSAVIVIGGIIFALIQMRQTRQQRRELAAIELFQWLAIKLEDLQADSDLPAYQSQTDWTPSNLSSEL